MELYEKIYLYRRLVSAKCYIDEHYAEGLNLDKIADQAHFSKFHFIRLFKAIYGFTPGNYLIKTRMEHARLHLANGHSVLESGYKVGLESPTSFAAMFRRFVGCSPSAYQKQAIARKLKMEQSPLQFVPNCFAESHGWIKSNIGETGVG